MHDVDEITEAAQGIIITRVCTCAHTHINTLLPLLGCNRKLLAYFFNRELLRVDCRGHCDPINHKGARVHKLSCIIIFDAPWKVNKKQLRIFRIDEGNVSKAVMLWKDVTQDPKRKFAGLDRPMNNPQQYLKADRAKWMWLLEV